MARLESLSLVIPCHNEAAVLEKTYHVLKYLADGWLRKKISDYEIVLVNNGSTDTTLATMLELHRRDKRVVVVDLRRNFGFQSSISAGLYNATKEMVVSIDADLQDDPEAIAEMIDRHYEGYDLVLGVRESRKTDSLLKRASAAFFYRVISVFGVKSVPNHGDFRLMSRALIEDLKQYGERNRYLRGLIFEMESRFACVYYDRRRREAGKSKFNIRALFRLAFDGIFSFSNKPVRAVFYLGLFMFLGSIVGIMLIVISKATDSIPVPGWASTATIFLFFSGLNNLCLGIIGEYLSRIYSEVKARPLFLVRKLHRHGKK